jgi:GAF domain-containing protein
MLNTSRDLIKQPAFEDNEKARVASVFQRILLALWLFPLLIIAVMLYSPIVIPDFTLPLFFFLALLTILTVMARWGFVRSGSVILLLGLITISTYIGYRAGGEIRTSVVSFVSIILIGGLLFGSRGGIIVFILLSIQQAVLSWAGVTGMIKPYDRPDGPIIDFLLVCAGYLIAMLIFQLTTSSLSNALKLSHAREKEIRALSENLDLRVQERTAELNRRSTQLEAAGLVARVAAEVRNPRELLENVVKQITERFNFYHAGIFLADANAQFVILEAASSEGGKRMIERGHRLEIGRQGIVGFAAYQKRSRIAQDIGEDTVFFNNPDLPETHSEVALPLIAQDQLIGILDIQSKERNAFSDEDIRTLQTMADQIALAIENTRLIDESRSAIEELQMLTSESTLRLWKERLGEQNKGYVYSSLGVFPIPKSGEIPASGSAKDSENAIKFPVTLHGQQIGILTLKRKFSEHPWTDVEQEMAGKIASQVALALENARLLEESQRRAEKESTISNITSKIRKTNDSNEMIRVAINELKQALNIKDVRIVPYNPPKNGNRNNKEE